MYAGLPRKPVYYQIGVRLSHAKVSWKRGQDPAFPPQSKVAFPEIEVLGKPRVTYF
jgi:hypothetical protein